MEGMLDSESRTKIVSSNMSYFHPITHGLTVLDASDRGFNCPNLVSHITFKGRRKSSVCFVGYPAHSPIALKGMLLCPQAVQCES